LLGIALALQGFYQSVFAHNNINTNNVMVDAKEEAAKTNFFSS